MTNPKTRKQGTEPANKESVRLRQVQRELEEEQCILQNWEHILLAAEGESDADSLTPTPTPTPEFDEEDDVASCSSFSLQECIDEFRARRIRRISTQSREVAEEHTTAACSNPVDEDLINQNRSNKEHERKSKPCKNGFCYCFTSDSGDGGGGCSAVRGGPTRVPRRVRKSENSQVINNNLDCASTVPIQLHESSEKRRLSAPATFKVPQTSILHKKQLLKMPATTHCALTQKQLTAFSRLETTSDDAPLIHIIQELHDNCVISEVRVNKEKIQAQQQQQQEHRIRHSPKKQTKQFRHERKCTSPPCIKLSPTKQHTPTAPPLEKISELDTPFEESSLVYSSPLDTSTKSAESPRQKHHSAGRLLQKRLSNNNLKLKSFNLDDPPPKPPRSNVSFEEKLSLSTQCSTSPSVREAERVLDAFLRSKGVTVPGEESLKEKSALENDQNYKKVEQRKSYPLTQKHHNTHLVKPLPSCPSLSDIDTEKSQHYGKNMRRVVGKSIKGLSFGWHEPKITEMLNYDAHADNRKEFSSQAKQAQPQSLGWKLPHKVDLDTVDGTVRHNLASNIEAKNTPIKTRLVPGSGKKPKSPADQKFIWGEQWRNLSPWSSSKQNGNNKNKHTQLKSNLKASSSAFLKKSKKKILRLVSPKKDNKAQRQNSTPFRTVGVQTSHEDMRSLNATPQSPPGSYHSALLQSSSQQSTTPTTRSQSTQHDGGGGGVSQPHFDFTRTIRSPPKKSTRASQRKLNFPLDCSAVSCNAAGAVSGDDCNNVTLTKTYHSFHSDLDQEATLSKMGYILSNIRAKLEASDEHALRTFQEIERREQQSAGIDCPDSHRIAQHARVDLHHNKHRNVQPIKDDSHELIYSEIEEHSVHISGSPQFHDNRTGIEHFPAEHDPYALYARVNKTKKQNPISKTKTTTVTAPAALGKLLHESLKTATTTHLPPLPETPRSSDRSDRSDVSYSSPPLTAPSEDEPTYYGTTMLSHCQSLNNIRVHEHHSPPKRNRNLSKSDLSLQRSEIFLENLCRGEIIVEDGHLERLEKVNNQNINVNFKNQINNTELGSPMYSPNADDDDYVSYESPQDFDDVDAHAAGSHLVGTAPAHINNQSTPKKLKQQQQQTFMTKHFFDKQYQLNVNINSAGALSQTSSCPTTPHKFAQANISQQQKSSHAGSLDEVCAKYATQNTNCSDKTDKESENKQLLQVSTLVRYKRLKNALQKSIRRSKNFVKSETKRLSTSLSFPSPHSSSTGQSNAQNQSELHGRSTTASSFDLDALFTDDAAVPVTQQLVNAVSVCRQLPDLEISPEMVEAERLLLLSTVRLDMQKQQRLTSMDENLKQRRTQRFFVDSMRVPVKADPNHDIFFNYFYICTFECGGCIRSTQSVECHNREAIFRECGIEFSCGDIKSGMSTDAQENLIRCEIFMLRLRKVSTLTLEPRKEIKLPTILKPSPTSTASSASSEQMVSRFRLHATFNLKLNDFMPYEYVSSESENSDQLCLRSTRTCNILLTKRKSTNIGDELTLNGRAEVRLPKRMHCGFLNVQHPHKLHNWNRRWCTLNGLHLQVWCDINDEKAQPLLSLDMCTSRQSLPITAAAPELCARARSFCLQCSVSKTVGNEEVAEDDEYPAAVFFAAETQSDLNAWLLQLNATMEFIATWLQS